MILLLNMDLLQMILLVQSFDDVFAPLAHASAVSPAPFAERLVAPQHAFKMSLRGSYYRGYLSRTERRSGPDPTTCAQ